MHSDTSTEILNRAFPLSARCLIKPCHFDHVSGMVSGWIQVKCCGNIEHVVLYNKRQWLLHRPTPEYTLSTRARGGCSRLWTQPSVCAHIALMSFLFLFFRWPRRQISSQANQTWINVFDLESKVGRAMLQCSSGVVVDGSVPASRARRDTEREWESARRF